MSPGARAPPDPQTPTKYYIRTKKGSLATDDQSTVRFLAHPTDKLKKKKKTKSRYTTERFWKKKKEKTPRLLSAGGGPVWEEKHTRRKQTQ